MYDSAIDAFWAAVRITPTSDALPASGSSDAPARAVEPPVRSLPMTAMPDRSTAPASTAPLNASAAVPLARSSDARARAGAALPSGATATARPEGGSRDAPDGLPARSANAPGADWWMRTLPLAASTRAASARLGGRRISSIPDAWMDENDAPARETLAAAPGPERCRRPVRAPCGRTCSSNSMVIVPFAASRAAADGDARRGPERSGRTSAASPRAAGISLPDRSAAAPRAASTETEAPEGPPCAAIAACRAALWAPVMSRWIDGPGVDAGTDAPTRPTRTVDGGGWERCAGSPPCGGCGETATAILAGSIEAGSTCSSNGITSAPDPMSSDGRRAEPGASASGPVSSGTTSAKPRSIPPYGLPDRSVRPAACPSMSISVANDATAAAFCPAVIVTRTDRDARPPSAVGIDGPYAETFAPDRDVEDGPVAAVAPAADGPPAPTSETPDALRPLAATYSSNVITTVPSSRSTTGGNGRAGGASSGSASITAASSPANALPDTSRTAPAATVRYTSGGFPVRPPPTRAASCSGETRTRSSVPSDPGQASAPASRTAAGKEVELVPDKYIPAGSAPSASTCSLNGTASRPCAMSSDGSVLGRISGGTASAVITSGAFERPANRRPAASEIDPYGRSSRTGPASRCALAAAPFCSTVRNMRSVSSSIVRSATSGPAGGTTRAPDRGTLFAPLASSMAAPDRSIPSAGTCSVNIIETMPRPRSRAGLASLPGASAGGTESSTIARSAPPGSPANALPERSAMPLPAATVIRSGPADAFAARSDAAWESVNSSTRRVPSAAAAEGNSAALPFRPATDTACGTRPPAPTNSSNSSVAVPVPRLKTGVPASAGGVPSRTTAIPAPASLSEGFPDRSCAAPGSASSRIAAPAAAAAAASSSAFCGGASATVTVSLAADTARAPPRETRSPPAAASTANAPASSPPGGAATCSS